MIHRSITYVLDSDVSRRALLKGVGKLVGIAVADVTITSTYAQTKLEKSAVQYQDTSVNGKACSECLQFIPGASSSARGICKVVAGEVNATGYCLAFTKKPAR